MKKEYDKEELDELMSKFYLNNLKYDISGLLLYSERNVIQYIEGEKDNIEKLYDNIKNDTRHKSVFLLHKKEIQQRLFTEWNANVNYIEYNKFRGFVDCIETINDEKISVLFYSFLRTNRLLDKY
jgi:hypothetical protein